MGQSTELKRIDFDKGEFMAGGKRYVIEGSLSIERYAEFQILEKEMAYGFTVKEIFDKLRKLWDNTNKLKFAENAIILHELMRGLAKLNEREPVVLKICTLFLNTEGEDRTTITTDLMTEKIKDWKEAGVDMRDFFQVATSSVNGFLELYKNVTLLISAQDEKPAAGNL